MAQQKKRKTRNGPSADAEPIRLQKLIAAAGLASRREAETWIRDGRVRVNGKVVRELGTRADPFVDRVAVDGKRVGGAAKQRLILLHKPRGVVTTTRDPHAKRTVLDLVPRSKGLFPVGRLDAGSEGLLLLTNDGLIGQALLHPSFEVPRTYRVSVDGRVRADSMRKLKKGVMIDGKLAVVQELTVISQASDRTVLELVLIEGRRRQIRRMLESLEHPVRRLVRTAFGPLRLGSLKVGECRELIPREQSALERMVRQQLGRNP